MRTPFLPSILSPGIASLSKRIPYGEIGVQLSIVGYHELVDLASLNGSDRENRPCRHGLLGEEGGVSGNSESEFLWAIDPLDGTTNFSHNYPSFGVSVAGACLKHPFYRSKVTVLAASTLHTYQSILLFSTASGI